MKLQHLKISITAKITALCLLITIAGSLVISIVCISILRDTWIDKKVAHSRASLAVLNSEISERFDDWDRLVSHSAVAAPFFITPYAANTDDMERLLVRFNHFVPDVFNLYATSAVHWGSSGGWAVFSDGTQPESNWDNTQRPWFRAAVAAQGKTAYTEPYVDYFTGILCLTVSKIIQGETGTTSGVMAADVALGFLEDLVKDGIAMPEQTIYLITANGMFVTNPDPDAVLKRNFFTEYDLPEHQRSILSGQEYFAMTPDTLVFSNGVEGTDWVLVSVIPAASEFAELNRMLVQLALLVGALLVVAAGIAVVFNYRTLTIPIRKIRDAANSLSQMDFSVNIEANRLDEIGEMQKAILQIRDNLKDSIAEIQSAKANLAIAKKSEKINDVVRGSFGIMEGMINNINGVNNNVNSQKESIQKASLSVKEIFTKIDSFKKTVMDQSSLVSESSKAIENIIASISIVRSTSENTRQTMDILGKSSHSGLKMMNQLLEELGNVELQSSSLQIANKTISDIAARTNILAMNAAIEAAHAGEAGRGFAVVAGEVRKLAELSSKESESVSQEIQKMGKIIEHIGAVSQETSKAMDTIFNGINNVNTSFKTIDMSIQAQSEEGVHVLGALKTVHEITMRVKTDTETIHTQSNAIHVEVEKLQEVSKLVNDGVGSVRNASGEIASFLENVKSLSGS